MQLKVDKMFLILGIIAFPNLFFRGQYNVPLLIFFYSCWQDSFKGFIMYLLIISWVIDFYLLFDYIAKNEEQRFYQSGQKGQVVLVVSIIVLVCKVHFFQDRSSQLDSQLSLIKSLNKPQRYPILLTTSTSSLIQDPANNQSIIEFTQTQFSNPLLGLKQLHQLIDSSENNEKQSQIPNDLYFFDSFNYSRQKDSITLVKTRIDKIKAIMQSLCFMQT